MVQAPLENFYCHTSSIKPEMLTAKLVFRRLLNGNLRNSSKTTTTNNKSNSCLEQWACNTNTTDGCYCISQSRWLTGYLSHLIHLNITQLSLWLPHLCTLSTVDRHMTWLPFTLESESGWRFGYIHAKSQTHRARTFLRVFFWRDRSLWNWMG